MITRRGFGKWLVLAMVLVALFLGSRSIPYKDWTENFTEWIKNQGAIGPPLFGLAYVIGTVFFVPGLLLTIAAGIAFGIFWGSVIALISSTAGAALAFLVGRHLAREKIEQRTANNPRFRRIDEAIGAEGWKIVLLLRLSPVIPFNLLNYFLGVTRIGFWPYVLASVVGMLPGCVLYVYLGHIGKATLSGEREHTTPEYIFLGLGLAATIAVTIYLGRIAKKALGKSNGSA